MSVVCRGLQIWNGIDDGLKVLPSISHFKTTKLLGCMRMLVYVCNVMYVRSLHAFTHHLDTGGNNVYYCPYHKRFINHGPSPISFSCFLGGPIHSTQLILYPNCITVMFEVVFVNKLKLNSNQIRQ